MYDELYIVRLKVIAGYADANNAQAIYEGYYKAAAACTVLYLKR